jgi:hypothetical protein
MTGLPPHGAVIVFDRVPNGSYAFAGVPYSVQRPSKRSDVYLRNTITGAGTMDRPWSYRDATWHPAT